MKFQFYLLLVASFACMSYAQSPEGIFCSCPPTLPTGSGSVLPSVAAKPFVKGILVRIGWSDLEPKNNQFNWTLLDSQFVRAKRYGKKITLAVLNGPAAPSWLFQQGAQAFPYFFRGVVDTLPLPWDSTYLAEWREVIIATGNRYRNDPTLTLVHITHSTYNGLEMQLPSTPLDITNWQTRGFSHSEVINSWQNVMDAFSTAFPNTSLDVDVHPVLQSDSVSREVVVYGYSHLGARFGVFAAWWSQRNTTVYPEQFALIHTASDSTFATVQMVASGTQDSAQFGEGGLPVALQMAVQNRIRYWEVWESDLLNVQYDSLFYALAEIVTSVPIFQETPQEYSLNQNYPNPFNPTTTIKFHVASFAFVSLKVYDVLGREVTTLVNTELNPGEYSVQFDAKNLPSGIYFYRLSSETFIQQRKMVVLR